MRFRKEILLSLFLGSICFSLASCEIKRPKDVLSDAKMEDVLYDYHIASAMGDQLNYDENYKKDLYMDFILDKYHIDRAVFDSSMVWYSNNPSLMYKIYEQVSNRLKAESEGLDKLIALREKKFNEPVSGDSVNLWGTNQVFRLTSTPLENLIKFSLKVDTTYHPQDTLCWNVLFSFDDSKIDSVSAPVMAMQVVYEKNDSCVSSVKRIYHQGWSEVRISADSLNDIKIVRGFVYHPQCKNKCIWRTDSINLMRYHKRIAKALKKDSLSVEKDSTNVEQLKKDSLIKDSVQ